MINTVLGKISKEELGHTRMHEHILWAWTQNLKNEFNRNTVIETMLPHLKKLKSLGCNTLVEATPDGAGRDIGVLKELSEKSGLNIITNCGVWDGLDYKGIYIPQDLKNKNSDEIAVLWIDEFKNGIDKSSIKPGFIKIGLGDNDVISDFQLTILKAAIITSKHTGLPIIAHICSSNSAKKIVEIVKHENLKLNKFVWSHADYGHDGNTIEELAKQGIWIEMSWHIGETKDYSWHTNTINKLNDLNLLDRLLISQDAGGFHNGNIVPYGDFYTGFIHECFENNISQKIIDQLLIENPMIVLDN